MLADGGGEDSMDSKQQSLSVTSTTLKVHKIENFFDSDFGICVISLLVMHK